ncbi:NUDIX hydrolase [Amorphus orientalis]|uniref:8-oxo-dGTP pyrophosphatase MutT (NUDIX family) n=1 Tax=Amorphus orientalis TaxID=649198 RepID=A0AAE3VQZ4_9HYPH|nr:NUDIX hydrolase [Amorphus orientalis]MDQ0316553.1 8-oxo-dGTP pyrophosphatase MutT (NUDIX family) [Amorphus orientalis]
MTEGAHSLRPLRTLEIGFRDQPPAFASDRRADISARWAEAVRANPALFNGTVLLFDDLAVEGDRLSVVARPVDYATFSAFLAWGGPVPGLANLFGAAAIVSSDGDLLLGRMGARTDDAGTVKLVGGTPDLSDVHGGRVDLVGSVARELAEETGLRAVDAERCDELLLFLDPPYAAVIQVLRFAQTTADLVAAIEAHLAADPDPELAGIVAIRARSDPGVVGLPRYTRAIVHHLFPA